MKINILSEPPADIFKNHGKYVIAFILILALACLGVLLGVYAIISDTKYYETLEKVALPIFVVAAVLLFYVGEKLQAYKKLNPMQKKQLDELCQQFFEIQGYCDLVAKANRRIILAEYEACENWAEEKKKIAEQDEQY